MAYVAPSSRSTGYLVTAANWNQDVVDNVTFLANRPACRVFNSANISVANLTAVQMTFDSERYDTASMHSTSADTGRITAPIAGVYSIGGCIEIAAGTDYVHMYVAIRLNGTTTIAAIDTGTTTDNSLAPIIAISTDWKLAAGEWVDLVVLHENGAAAARNALASAGRSPEFWARWECLG